MTPADYRRKLQQLYRQLQNAALADRADLAVFTHDYGLIWLETAPGHDEQQETIRRWQHHFPEERWFLPLAPFYLPLKADNWAGIPFLAQVDQQIRDLPEALVAIGRQRGLLTRDPEASMQKLIMAEAQARQDVLGRMTAIERPVVTTDTDAPASCWHCDSGDPHNCLGGECVNFGNRQNGEGS